jgi:hypothetical protein
MKHLTKILTIALVLFAMASCSEDLLQDEDTVAKNKSSRLKCTCVEDCTYETAWAAGQRYTPRGNWATYTPNPGLEACVVIYAGQDMYAGQVCFEEGDPGYYLLVIHLSRCWFLQDVNEPIKIQGYDVAPSGNPAPGKFITYKGSGTQINVAKYEVTVPIFNYYGIHLDLENCNE